VVHSDRPKHAYLGPKTSVDDVVEAAEKSRVLTSFRGLVKFMNFLVKLHEVCAVSRTVGEV
jgi:hypothetical protein